MLIFILMIFSSVFAQSSNADIDRRIFLPRSLALSGDMAARINLNESLYFNPASSAHSKCFSIDGGYAWQHYSGLPSRLDNYYINAVDTENEMFGGGIGYVKRTMGTAEREWEFRGLINKLLFGNRLGFGVGVSYLSHTYLGQNNHNLNADIGFLLLLTKKTILGANANNLFGDNNDINTRSIDLGIRHTLWDFFSASFNFEHRFSKKIKATGALEMLYKNGIMVAVSAQRNQETQNSFWGLGVGYVAPKMSVLYGTMNSISYPYSFMHSFSLRVFF